MSNVLLVFDSPAREIAERIAHQLREHGHQPALVPADGELPRVTDYDAVVLGARVLFGYHSQAIADYVVANRDSLWGMPNAFFAVGGERRFQQAFFQEVGWQPDHTATFPVLGNPAAAIDHFADEVTDEIDATLWVTNGGRP